LHKLRVGKGVGGSPSRYNSNGGQNGDDEEDEVDADEEDSVVLVHLEATQRYEYKRYAQTTDDAAANDCLL